MAVRFLTFVVHGFPGTTYDQSEARRFMGRRSAEEFARDFFTGPDPIPWAVVKVPFGPRENSGGHAVILDLCFHRAFDETTCREIVIMREQNDLVPYDLIPLKNGKMGVERHSKTFTDFGEALQYANETVQHSL
jgi:hypothetical protein